MAFGMCDIVKVAEYTRGHPGARRGCPFHLGGVIYAMPYKAKKPCAYRGCREITNKRYCDTHAKLEAKRYNHTRRDPASGKRYGSTWKKIRDAFLSANPLCVMCKEAGRLTPATVAHHKVKVSDGGLNDWSNMEALCQECHSRLHAKQGDYF
jgi:5-methylcytosine-specific restriction protein A